MGKTISRELAMLPHKERATEAREDFKLSFSMAVAHSVDAFLQGVYLSAIISATYLNSYSADPQLNINGKCGCFICACYRVLRLGCVPSDEAAMIKLQARNTLETIGLTQLHGRSLVLVEHHLRILTFHGVPSLFRIVRQSGRRSVDLTLPLAQSSATNALTMQAPGTTSTEKHASDIAITGIHACCCPHDSELRR